MAISIAQVLQTANVVLVYWVISISMVFFNKSLVGGHRSSNKAEEIDVSIYVAWSQCVVCVLFILIYSKVGSTVSDTFQVSTLLVRC